MKHVKFKYTSIYSRYIKRGLDLIFAALLFLLLLPIFILISSVILISSGSPIFYRAQRCGYHGKPFCIFKFRTMIKDADKTGGQTTALNDKRITKAGHFLRKTKLDEIPQLINIIKGEMSFVGPRPELIKYIIEYNEEERMILEVKPGITDYSSLEFINLDLMVGENNADEVYENIILPLKNKLRMKYVEVISFRTDCKLFLDTIVKVIHITMRFINHKHH
jgi:lipopolysaccharide/colanic/teichoic acid biosynthesis glycosyltransferase